MATKNRKAIQAERKLAKQCEKEAKKMLKLKQKSRKKRVYHQPEQQETTSEAKHAALSISSSDEEAVTKPLAASAATLSQKKKLAAPMPKPAESVFSEYDTATNNMCKWKM